MTDSNYNLDEIIVLWHAIRAKVFEKGRETKSQNSDDN